MSSYYGRGNTRRKMALAIFSGILSILLLYGVSKTAANSMETIGYFGRYSGACIGVRNDQGFFNCPTTMPVKYSYQEVPDSFSLKDLIATYK